VPLCLQVIQIFQATFNR